MFKKKINISNIKLYVTRGKEEKGLLCFASCVINKDFFLNGMAIYKKLDGGYRITFPKRKDRFGRAKEIFYPINSEVYKILADALISDYLKIIKKDKM